jgi:hypothetical protein
MSDIVVAPTTPEYLLVLQSEQVPTVVAPTAAENLQACLHAQVVALKAENARLHEQLRVLNEAYKRLACGEGGAAQGAAELTDFEKDNEWRRNNGLPILTKFQYNAMQQRPQMLGKRNLQKVQAEEERLQAIQDEEEKV